MLTERILQGTGAGGIGGAEGSIVLLLKGTEGEVRKAIGLIERIKGEAPVREPK